MSDDQLASLAAEETGGSPFDMGSDDASEGAGHGNPMGISRSVTQVEIDPARVRLWPGNARVFDGHIVSECRDLIEAILRAEGQTVPAVLREVIGDPRYDYEVIAGTRRHFAVSWLRANGYPDMKFIGVVQTMSDREAFVLADAENRGREDVSAVARARNYAAALSTHFGGKQADLADWLRVSKSWLSKILCVAAIPDSVLLAFERLTKASLASLYQVAKLLHDSEAAHAIEQEAKVIAEENGNRSWDGAPPIEAPEVIRRLKAAGRRAQGKARHEAAINQGRPILTVEGSDNQGTMLRLHHGTGATRDEVIKAITAALDTLNSKGERVWR